jgi:hypothetical protein
MRKTSRKRNDVLKLIESKMSRASIRRSNAKARQTLLRLRLAEFRKAMKIDQSSVKGFSQPAVSRIESRDDIKLSTLVDYCEALGAELEISAKPAKRHSQRFVLLKAG